RFEPILRAREAGVLPREQFDAYLANLPRSGLVPLSTCRLLLTVDDETARLHAVQQLLMRESPDGVESVLNWVEAATMSDDDAISLLAKNPKFAAEALRAREGRPTADRLLQAFSQKAENVVRVGSWLRCSLGWGRIDGIEHRDSGASVRWCIGGSSPYRLTVTLRPDEHAEIVCIDLLSSTAEFVEPGYVRTCTECEQFSTQDLDLLSKHHLAAHRQGTPQDRKYFRDGFARFRVEESRSIPLSSFELVSVKPSKQLV
ncbi:MAG: hypothetical protein JXA93_19865, partial [Anaerolineae bacterium]|nr:hypothetical protein [Anaerolineae bacterium]